MQNIETWMKQFSQEWAQYNIEKVMSLFTQDVEYWESPYEKFENFEEMQDAWEYIKTQRNICFSYDVFSWDAGKYAIEWTLKYEWNSDKKQIWSWIYLIKLNEKNLCYYFKQVWEKGN